MSLKTLAIKNAVANWVALAVYSVIGFFLAPFVLHHLGDQQYGLYYLVLSFLGYYSVLDLGIRSSTVKYVASFHATGDEEGLNCLINTTVFAYCCIAIVFIVLVLVGVFYLGSIFRISPDFLHTAKLLLLIAGVGGAMSLPACVFPAILEGLQKYTWTSSVNIIVVLLRAALVVWLLGRGYGLLTLALIGVGVYSVLCNAIYIVLALRATRPRFGWKYVRKDTLRMVLKYGAKSLANTAAALVRSSADYIVIGIFLSPVAVTYYSIGQKLQDYPARLVRQLAAVFLPLASHLDAAAETERMNKLLIEGNRICAFITFPCAALFVILGKPLIALWMGPRYVASSYIILVILMAPTVLWFSQIASTRILYGMNRHEWLAKVRMTDGVVSLILCLLLVRPFGITGVAIGLSVPWAFVAIFLLGPHLCRTLHLPLLRTFARTYLPPLALTAPLVALLLFMQHLFPVPQLSTFVLQVVCGAVLYGSGLLWLFLTKEAMGIKVRGQLIERLKESFGRS